MSVNDLLHKLYLHLWRWSDPVNGSKGFVFLETMIKRWFTDKTKILGFLAKI